MTQPLLTLPLQAYIFISQHLSGSITKKRHFKYNTVVVEVVPESWRDPEFPFMDVKRIAKVSDNSFAAICPTRNRPRASYLADTDGFSSHKFLKVFSRFKFTRKQSGEWWEDESCHVRGREAWSHGVMDCGRNRTFREPQRKQRNGVEGR